ncbi:unnamed protein product [Protopolystoma xenopodis]|uniref:Uncharacterized protein n=1 Tax=Protopolystoma xenopodis TaxID=117903 RepID=A0A3S4ZFR2_9PLAT|nr:unnamed protein product [Protopolystoma xenopodis]
MTGNSVRARGLHESRAFKRPSTSGFFGQASTSETGSLITPSRQQLSPSGRLPSPSTKQHQQHHHNNHYSPLDQHSHHTPQNPRMNQLHHHHHHHPPPPHPHQNQQQHHTFQPHQLPLLQPPDGEEEREEETENETEPNTPPNVGHSSSLGPNGAGGFRESVNLLNAIPNSTGFAFPVYPSSAFLASSSSTTASSSSAPSLSVNSLTSPHSSFNLTSSNIFPTSSSPSASTPNTPSSHSSSMPTPLPSAHLLPQFDPGLLFNSALLPPWLYNASRGCMSSLSVGATAAAAAAAAAASTNSGANGLMSPTASSLIHLFSKPGDLAAKVTPSLDAIAQTLQQAGIRSANRTPASPASQHASSLQPPPPPPLNASSSSGLKNFSNNLTASIPSTSATASKSQTSKIPRSNHSRSEETASLLQSPAAFGSHNFLAAFLACLQKSAARSRHADSLEVNSLHNGLDAASSLEDCSGGSLLSLATVSEATDTSEPARQLNPFSTGLSFTSSGSHHLPSDTFQLGQFSCHPPASSLPPPPAPPLSLPPLPPPPPPPASVPATLPSSACSIRSSPSNSFSISALTAGSSSSPEPVSSPPGSPSRLSARHQTSTTSPNCLTPFSVPGLSESLAEAEANSQPGSLDVSPQVPVHPSDSPNLAFCSSSPETNSRSHHPRHNHQDQRQQKLLDISADSEAITPPRIETIPSASSTEQRHKVIKLEGQIKEKDIKEAKEGTDRKDAEQRSPSRGRYGGAFGIHIGLKRALEGNLSKNENAADEEDEEARSPNSSTQAPPILSPVQAEGKPIE